MIGNLKYNKICVFILKNKYHVPTIKLYEIYERFFLQLPSITSFLCLKNSKMHERKIGFFLDYLPKRAKK